MELSIDKHYTKMTANKTYNKHYFRYLGDDLLLATHVSNIHNVIHTLTETYKIKNTRNLYRDKHTANLDERYIREKRKDAIDSLLSNQA